MWSSGETMRIAICLAALMAISSIASAQVILAPLAPRAPEERHPKVEPQPRPANLNSIAEGPLVAPSTPGSLHIRGKVVGKQLPSHLRVTAVSEGRFSQLLMDLHRDCISDMDHAPLVCGCGDAELELFRDLDQREGEAKPVSRAEVAADGSFDLAGLPEGEFTLWLDGTGALSSISNIRAGNLNVSLPFGSGIEIHGRVVDEIGQPIRDAIVSYQQGQETRFFDAVTAPDGTFALRVTQLDHGALFARHAGFHFARVRMGSVDLAHLELVLRDPRAISGIVVRDGAPAAGAEVAANSLRCRATAKTDAQGHFRLERLLGESYELEARQPNALAKTTLRIAPSEDDHAGIELVLQPRAELAGRVLDASGKPVWEAQVQVEGESDAPHALTAEDGTYLLRDLPPGKLRLRAKFEATWSELKEIDISKPDQRTSLDFTLVAGPKLRGTLLRPDEKPAANVGIDANGPLGKADDETRADWFHGQTDEHGNFALALPVPGRYRLRASVEELPALEQAVQVPHTSVTLRIPRGARVQGKVAGVPKGFKVFANLKPIVPATSKPDPGQPGIDVDGDATGGFVFNGLAAGKYVGTISITKYQGGSGTWRSQGVAFTLIDGQTKALSATFGPGKPIAGRVIDEAGHAMARVEIRFGNVDDDLDDLRSGEVATHAAVVSDDDGRFQTGPLDSGSYAWKVDTQLAIGSGSAKAGDANVVVAVRTNRMVRGRVLNVDKTPVTEFQIADRTVRAADGHFEMPFSLFRPKSSGSANLEIRKVGFVSERRDLDWSPAGDQDLGDIVLAPPRTLEVAVVDSVGKPIPGAKVRATVSNPSKHFEVCPEPARSMIENGFAAAEQGTAKLNALPAYPLLLEASAAGHADAVLAVDASATRATVKLEAGHRVVGRVRDSAGKHVEGLIVCAQGPDHGSTELTKADGTFAFDDLPAGELSVLVYTWPEQSKKDADGLPDETEVIRGPSAKVQLPQTQSLELRWTGPRP